jgi:spermidine synthase
VPFSLEASSPVPPSPVSPSRRPLPVAAIALMYFFSGLIGLVDEVTFSKYLSFVFGATAYASSAVLVAFMGGLAVGAHVAGRLERRVARPLLAYGAAEIAVGLFCLLAPSLFGAVTPLYVALAHRIPSLAAVTLVRYALASAIVFVPAAGMGATLPFLARFMAGEDHGSTRRRLAVLYGLNTAGGALGSLTSAYFILPTLGLSWTLRTSALASLLIGATAAWLGRQHLYGTDAGAADPRRSRPPPDLVFLAAVSGLLVFGCEVVFVHLLALVIGTSVYAFGLMLAIVLVCLALGTPLAALLARWDRERALAVSLALSALALAATLPVWDKLPALFVKAGPQVTSFGARESVRALAAFLALAAPVTAMGTTFPLVLSELAGRDGVAANVGRVTVANTLGSIAGSVLAGFLVLPHLGSQHSLVAASLAYAAVALLFAWRLTLRRGWAPALAAGAAVLLGLSLPAWNLFELTSGAGVYFERQDGAAESILMMREDVHGGVTTVTRNGSVITLWTNGKFQGNDGDEVDPQRGLGHLPTAFAPRFGRALVVGAGTAATAGVMASYPYQRIDLAEISPAILEAARTYFAGINRDVFRDPRLFVRKEDGRNLLLVEETTYDVITVEISSIWFAGAANLYNREFYELVDRRLAPGGILQQWIQLHHMRPREIAGILASVRAVFPHVTLFANRHQGHILASKVPLVVDRARLPSLEAMARAHGTLGPEESLDRFIEGAVIEDDALDLFLEATAKEYGGTKGDLVSTDDNLYLEYRTPKNNVPDADDWVPTLERIRKYAPEGLAERYLSQ